MEQLPLGSYITVVVEQKDDASNEHEYLPHAQQFYCNEALSLSHDVYRSCEQKPDVSGIMHITEEMVVDGLSTEFSSDGSRKDRVEIKNEINSTTERINHYLAQMAETKQTRQRLADLLKEANDYEMNLKNQLKAEIEKGNELKEELKSATEGPEDDEEEEEVVQDGLYTTDVEKYLEQLDDESKINCLFVECIATGPTDEGDYGAVSEFHIPELSSFVNPNDFIEPMNVKRKTSVKKHFDDVAYEPRKMNRGLKIGKRGRKRGSYKKKTVGEDNENNAYSTEESDMTASEPATTGNEEEMEGTSRTLKLDGKMNMYICPTCGETFTKLYLRKRHETQEHPSPDVDNNSSMESRAQRTFQCSMCKLSFLRLIERTQHEENDHSPTDEKIAREPWRKKRTFKCHICDAMFPWFKDMQKHVRDEHYAKDPNMCDVCGKTFVTRFVLKNHKKLHAPVRPFPCSVCPKSYKTNGELKSHFRVHTGEKPFKCSECDLSFSNTIQRKIHQREHTGERPPYVCSECHYEFHLRGSLVKHMRIHTGERPYLCADCGKSFTESSGYKVHLRLHTGVRPYVCNDCGKSYVQSERLKTHQRTHTGEKRYACTVCGMRYMYSRGLRDHMEKHTGEVRHACTECNRKFVNEMTLGKHMRKHIKKEVALEYYVVDGEF